jgi:hypothetical protein
LLRNQWQLGDGVSGTHKRAQHFGLKLIVRELNLATRFRWEEEFRRKLREFRKGNYDIV